jgi:hypothetical protein
MKTFFAALTIIVLVACGAATLEKSSIAMSTATPMSAYNIAN